MSARTVKRGAKGRKPARKKTVQPKGPADKLLRGSIVAFFVIFGVAILFVLGVPQSAARGVGSALGGLGFRVNNVDVVGIDAMDPDPVYRIALEERETALPLVDVEGVRDQLMDFGYVRDARVSRRYPDTLVIDIVERTPRALWQDDERLMLVDEEGVVLGRVPVAQMPDLPLLLGPGANRNYPELQRILEREPALASQLASARWVGGRRWDLNVATGEILALPEGEKAASDALAAFMRNDRANPLLGIGVKRYDLRIEGQAIARMPEPVDTYLEGADGSQ
ncbi:MAG: FtsQ-type POTRA domain-containing protein [Sphingomonas sp.]|nr:FtsQ-type POTRA domain-containing protein [Sphingomonas sp.]